MDIINQLQGHYESIGVYCPRLIRNRAGRFIHTFQYNGRELICYLEEFAKYPLYESESMDYDFKKKVLIHLGLLANRFSEVGITVRRSMWSIIKLAPLDVDVDEKQENCTDLVNCIRSHGFGELANEIDFVNIKARNRIKKNIDEFPECVYQGDLNHSNVLINDSEEVVGLIDFNNYGTEININCFLNETMFYLEEHHFEGVSAESIHDLMVKTQGELMDIILTNYELNDLERELYDDYNRIIYLSFYPNVRWFIYLMERGQHVEKVTNLISQFLKM